MSFSSPAFSRSTRALAHRQFRRWTAASTVSIVGTWMQSAAQAWVVLELTGSSTALGLAVSIQALPSLVLGLWGGVLADRWPRRRLLVSTHAMHALLAIGLALMCATDTITVGALFVCAVISGLLSATEGPATAALSAELVPREDLPSALALGGVVHSLGRVLGMAAAGMVLSWVGPSTAFAVNALSFVPLIVVIRSLSSNQARAARAATSSAWSDLVAGLRTVRRHPTLPLTFMVSMTLGAFGRNYQVTMAVMSSEVFGRGASGYALLSTVFAIGALAGGVAAAHWGSARLRWVLGVGAIGAWLQLLSAATPSFVSFAALIGGIGALAVMFDTAVSSHVQTSVADDVRGRVSGAAMAAGAIAGTVGAPVLGALAEAMGGRAALGSGAVVCLAAVAVAVHRRGDRALVRDAFGSLRPGRIAQSTLG